MSAIDPHVERLRAATSAFADVVDAVASSGGLDRPTPAGWTAKEMLAHVAFWDEAVFGFVQGVFRGRLPDGWRFGSGYTPDLGQPWPAADAHNAREAAWAHDRDASEVVARWRAAQEQLFAVLATVTDEEVAANLDYFSSLGAHHDEHRAELGSLAG